MFRVVIVGANFINKGAQSMLFVTVDQIKKRFKNSEIYFATSERYNEKDYAFLKLYYSRGAKAIALEKKNSNVAIKTVAKEIAKTFLGYGFTLAHLYDAKKIIQDCDLIIDISGYNLGDCWTLGSQEGYLDNIRIARFYNKPIILMPQSFGPFNYRPDESYIYSEIVDLLQYPEVVYVREQAGYDLLASIDNINAKLSTDLVLQSDDIELGNIFLNTPQIIVPDIQYEDSVAVIPNMRCFAPEHKEKTLERYKTIIDCLLANDKKVYILAHAKDDVKPCQWIYDMYTDNDYVCLLDNDFSCIEYDVLVRRFQFIICSRFHGVVHAYRNCIPCVVLGWAVKYQELAKHVNQNQYVFDLISGDEKDDDLFNIVQCMLHNYDKESHIIGERLREIRKDNCFDILENYAPK